MFVYTVKASKIKFFAVLFLAVGVLATLIAMTPKYENYEDVAVVATNYSGVSSNDDRLRFISQFGYAVNTEPCEIVDVTIPDSFDSVYESYNEVQRSQGLNLKKYKGKTVTRYSYVITDYEGYENETVLCNLLIYKNKIIAGDVCCNSAKSFMHGFQKPVASK